MLWNRLKECSEHSDEVEARCDKLQLRQARMFRDHQQPPANLLQNINASLVQRMALRDQFMDLVPLVRFYRRNAVILVGADVRAIVRAMHVLGQGRHLWYRVGHTVGNDFTSVERNAENAGFPLAPPGHRFDWMHVMTGPHGNIVEFGNHHFVG